MGQGVWQFFFFDLIILQNFNILQYYYYYFSSIIICKVCNIDSKYVLKLVKGDVTGILFKKLYSQI